MTDNALYFLLKLLSVFFKVLFKIVDNETSSEVFISNFPRTLYSFRKILGVSKKSFKRFEWTFFEDLPPPNDSIQSSKSYVEWHLWWHSICSKKLFFESECEQWQEQLDDPTSNVLSDEFDEKIWRTFKWSEELFFTKERTHGLMDSC